MISKEVTVKVEHTPAELGTIVAGANSIQQSEFIRAMIATTRTWRVSGVQSQLLHVAQCMTKFERALVIQFAQTVIEYFRD